jgi:hypothetical protein
MSDYYKILQNGVKHLSKYENAKSKRFEQFVQPLRDFIQELIDREVTLNQGQPLFQNQQQYGSLSRVEIWEGRDKDHPFKSRFQFFVRYHDHKILAIKAESYSLGVPEKKFYPKTSEELLGFFIKAIMPYIDKDSICYSEKVLQVLNAI